MAGRGHEQQRLFQFDDALPDGTHPIVLARTLGQALQAGRERGHVLRVLAAQILGRGDDQTVP